MRSLIGLAILVGCRSLPARKLKRYGDISYAQLQDCSVMTAQNKGNPYTYLFRDNSEL